jgi:hypothetical protein
MAEEPIHNYEHHVGRIWVYAVFVAVMVVLLMP